MNRLQMLKKAGGGLNSKLWWLAPGMSYTNILAAYQFAGAESSAAALLDHSPNGYDIAGTSVSWDAAHGLTAGTFTQTDLSARTDIITQIICYSNYSWGQSSNINGVVRLTSPGYTSGGNPMLCLRMRFSVGVHGNDDDYTTAGNGYWGVITAHGSTSSNSGTNQWCRYKHAGARAPSSGIVAYDKTNVQLYLDGEAVSTTSAGYSSWHGSQGGYLGSSQKPVYTSDSLGTMYVQGAVFYNCVLTASQHAAVAEMMTYMFRS